MKSINDLLLPAFPRRDPATDMFPAVPSPPVVAVRVTSLIWMSPPTKLILSPEVVRVAPEALLKIIFVPVSVV